MTRIAFTSLLFFIFLCTGVRAQVTPRTLPFRVDDAVRFSMTQPIGSARFAGTGGSMTAIGVDGATLHTNPAGIGWNRFSAAQITPGFSLAGVDAQLRGNPGNGPTQENTGNFIVPNASLIWAGDTRSVNWSTFNFGISYTRLADLNETIVYEGRSEGSIIQAVAEDLNDGVSDPTRAGLAISIPGTLIPDGDFFTTDFDVPENAGAQIFRSGRVARTGNISELALGFGGNYKEKVLWGFTLGIPSINFTETKVYNEVDDQGEVTFYDDAGFDETLEMTGSGVNFKFGLIGRPTDQLRISAAVHSPTLWTIDETFFTDFEYNYTDAGQALGGTAESDLFVESINLATPWRFFLGGGYLIGNNGFISVDADYSNFAGNQFSSDDFAQVNDAANEDIDQALTSSIGVRLGGELNLKPFQVRAGVGYRTQPYVDQRNGEDTALLNYSAGAGYSIGKFFIDVAARLEGNNTYYAPYRTFNFDGQVVDTERTRITGMLTVGFRGF
jgi:hypothetical protein